MQLHGRPRKGSSGKRWEVSLLGLLVFWGVVGWWWRLARGHVDIVRVAGVVIGAGSAENTEQACLDKKSSLCCIRADASWKLDKEREVKSNGRLLS